MGNSWQYPYDTGWINCSDWTNRHLGSNTTLNTDSNVTHGLNAPLSNLLVELILSTDGTDANSLKLLGNDGGYQWTIYQIDLNNIKIQTGVNGLYQLSDATGGGVAIDTENWYYKVKVYFLG